MDKMREQKGRAGALRIWFLTAAAVMLVMSATMGIAWAYFTTYTTAKGGITLRLGHEEHVKEYFKNWNKRVDIEISEDSRAVFVRARGYSAKYPLTYSDVEVDLKSNAQTVNKNWRYLDDGWAYYTKVLAPGAGVDGTNIADPLYVQIHDVPVENIQGVDNKDPFNVIIVYETTEVEYDSSGNPINPWDADWDAKVDTNRAGGDN
jgi:hypothetical protein